MWETGKKVQDMKGSWQAAVGISQQRRSSGSAY